MADEQNYIWLSLNIVEHSSNHNQLSTPFHILCSIDLVLHRIEPSINVCTQNSKQKPLQYTIKVKAKVLFSVRCLCKPSRAKSGCCQQKKDNRLTD